MMKRLTCSVLATAMIAVVPAVRGQELGTISFPNSGAAAGQSAFLEGVKNLHSFQFDEAAESCQRAQKADPAFAMAYWCEAMSHNHPLWAQQDTAAAKTILEKIAPTLDGRLARVKTDKEKAFLRAIDVLYYSPGDKLARDTAYSNAMAQMYAQWPDDHEVATWYALSLLGTVRPADRGFRRQAQAAAIAQKVFAENPKHPGAAHFIIHAFDDPDHAPLGLPAARLYAGIAPAAAHALHMPSHTFTRVGMWSESVNTNLRSMEAARRDSSVGEQLHAMDYAVYAYLQMRKDAEAKRLMDMVPGIVPGYDVNAIRGAASGASGMFAVAAIPARWAIERREWKEAAAIQPKTSQHYHTDAISWFAQAAGAAKTGDRAKARMAIDTLRALNERLTKAGEAYWAEQVAIQALEARALLYQAEGSPKDALITMEEAVKREDATEKSAVTPGPIVPAHELLGDMLFEMRRHREALDHYRESMRKEPGRFRSLYGAMKAAEAIGDRKEQAGYAAQIEKLTGSTTWTK